MKAIEKAYLAGFLDGEGCFTLIRSSAKKAFPPCWAQSVQVVNTNKAALEALRQEFGGHLYKRNPREKNRKPIFVYLAANGRARKLISSVLPYLRLKAKVASVVLNFPQRSGISLGRGRGAKPDMAGYRKQLAAVKKVRQLNRRGVTTH